MRGEIVTIGSNVTFLARVYLYSPADELVASEITYTYTDPYLEKVRLPATGTYRIVMERYYGTGAIYRIGLLGETRDIPTLVYGDEVAIVATAEQTTQTYVLDTHAGDVVNIELHGGFDTSVNVYNEAGNYVVGDSVKFGGRSQILEWIVGDSGQYTIIATYPYFDLDPDSPSVADDTNQYTLIINEVTRSALVLPRGESIEAVIDEDEDIHYTTETHYYQFVGQADEQFQLAVDDLYEPTIIIYTSDFQRLLNINITDDFYTRTLSFTLPKDDTYLVSVYQEYGFNSPYTLELTQVETTVASNDPIPEPTAIETIQSTLPELHRHETITGEITSNDLEQWSLTAINGEVLFFGLKTDGFTPELNLFNPPYLFTPSPSPANNVGDYTAAIVNFNVSETAVYQITANRISPLETGTYELILLPMHEVATLLPYNTEVIYEPTTDGSINHLWYFPGTRDDEIQLNFEAEATVRYTLYGPYGNLVERISENETTLTLPIEGTYAIWIQNPPATYTLQVFSDNPIELPDPMIVTHIDSDEPSIDETPVTAVNQDIEYGSEVSDNLISNQRQPWEFTAQAGDTISAEITSNFDSYIEIFGADGLLLLANDDTHELDAAILEFEIPADGIYTLVVSGIGNTQGAYILSLDVEN